MLVRKMTVEDIPKIVQIERACFSLPWSENSFLDSLSRSDTIFLLCEHADGIAGYIGMYLSLDEASITNVAVLASERRHGIGETLVLHAQQAAKEAGAEVLFLEVRVSNTAAISLYEKTGFTMIGTRKKFYEHPIEDAYIMRCILQ